MQETGHGEGLLFQKANSKRAVNYIFYLFVYPFSTDPTRLYRSMRQDTQENAIHKISWRSKNLAYDESGINNYGINKKLLQKW